jgi:hypothetical protein
VAEFDSVIPAGGSGTLTAKVHTRSTQTGAVSKSVSVTTTDPAAQRLMLGVSFRVTAPVAVLPRPQIYLSGVQGDQPQSVVLLRRDDGEPLEVVSVESEGGRLELSTSTVTEAQRVDRVQALPGDVALRARVAGGVTDANANGTIRVTTNHPKAATVDIVYSLRMRPVVEARPMQVRLVLEEGNSAGRTGLLRLQHNRGTGFSVTGLRPSDPSVFRSEVVGTEGAPSSVHTVSIRLADEVLPGAFIGRRMESLVVTTDDASSPEIHIPVMIEARAPREHRRSRPAS